MRRIIILLVTTAIVVTSCLNESAKELYPFEKEIKKKGTITSIYGYTNDKGRTVIKPRYLDAKSFDDNGIAPVLDNDNEWKCINKSGEVIFISKYGEIDGCDDNIFAIHNNEGKWGFVNGNNDIIVPFIIDKRPKKCTIGEEERYWVNGMCLVCDEYEPTDIIDLTGNIISTTIDYSKILGFFNSIYVLERNSGEICVLDIMMFKQSKYSNNLFNCPQRIVFDWDHYNRIYYLRENSSSFGARAFTVRYEGNPDLDIPPFFLLFNANGELADTTSFESLKEVADQGYDVLKCIYPISMKEDKRYVPFNEEGKWGIKDTRYDDKVIVAANNIRPVYFYKNEGDIFTDSYTILNDGVSSHGRDFILNEYGKQIFPIRFFFKSLPDQYGLAVVQYSRLVSDLKTELMTGILDIRKGLLIKELYPFESISPFENGRATITQNDPIPYDYEIDTLGIEFHDFELYKKVHEERYRRDNPKGKSSGIDVAALLEEQNQERMNRINDYQRKAVLEVLKSRGVIP